MTAEQMRAMDRYTIEEVGISSLVLMERAGIAVAQCAMDHFPTFQHVIVLCGRGNNGGDGLVAARHLWEMGKRVQAFVVGEGELSQDALVNLGIAQRLGVPVKRVTESPAQLAEAREVLIVDALLGTGFSGEVRQPLASVIDEVNRARKRGAKVIAVDVPSGVNASTGQVASHCVEADLTVTFHCMKLGLATYPGAAKVGRVEVCPIGIPRSAWRVVGEEGRLELLDDEVVGALLVPRSPWAHKGDAGRVVVLGGSKGFTGAALLAARGALRAGAGLVTLGVPGGVYDVVAPCLPEVMTSAVGEGQRFSASDAEAALRLCSVAKAIALGPGIGTAPETVEFVGLVLEGATVPLVLDADGLNCVAGNLESLKRCRAPVVVTPHPGEMGRLCGVPASEIQRCRVEWARKLAREARVVCVLKGPRTVVAAPDGSCFVNPTGCGAMAAPGMGDVLTGVVAALCAQGMLPLDAAIAGVYLHGLAGEAIGLDRGVLASQVADKIPHLITSRFTQAKGTD
ncbi:MAG: NAD(P)H-hydrate dehydratase [Bacillota bacterium]